MKKLYCSFFLFIGLIAGISAQVYVNQNAPGPGDGSSWEDAYTDLQDALVNASEEDTIWVAAGTYLPGDNPNATFLISRNLVLLGGFVGGETSANERDPITNLTILSGDLNGDDMDDDFDNFRGDNVMTVLMIESNVTNETLIDGFMINGGHADGTGGNFYDPARSGGGIYAEGAPMVRHCIFQQNFSTDHGGGAYFKYLGHQLLQISMCSFTNNYARRGAGLNIENSDCEVTGCQIKGNIATQHGGGFRYSSSNGNHSATVRNCIFEDNHSTFAGGARLETQGDNNNFVVVDCQFRGNTVSQLNPPWDQGSGGLGITFWPETSNNYGLVDNCQFEQNSSTRLSGALGLGSGGENTTFELRNSTFTSNTSAVGSTVSIWGGNEGTGTAWVDSCHFENNVAAYGGGLDFSAFQNGGADYEFNLSNSTFNSNVAWEGGALIIWQDTLSKVECNIERCTMMNNLASIFGGAIGTYPHNNDYHINIRHSIITENESPEGGAIAANPWFVDVPLPDSASVLIENSLITRNSGASILSAKRLPNLELLNCTTADNDGVGVVLADESGLQLQNTILYNPGYNEFEALSEEVVVISHGGNIVFDNSMNGSLLSIDKANTDPLLTSDYYPNAEAESPCIDMGVDMDNLAEFDLDGNPRVSGSAVDIGAYEFLVDRVREMIVGKLSVSPNPSRDLIHIQLSENVSDSIDMHLFDAQGRWVGQRQARKGATVNIRELQSGLYTLRLTDGKRLYFAKFLKQ